MKKKLILVAAPPACGKTFVSEKLAQEMGHIAYFDKDDLCPLVGRLFDLSGKPRDMDSEFYGSHIRDAEYETMFRVAMAALRFENLVLVNAPFGKEVRCPASLRKWKETLNADGTNLVLIWVLSTPELCRERMIRRNAVRDIGKLQNWEAYVAGIDYSTPVALEHENAVDLLIPFDTADEQAFERSFRRTVELLAE